MTYTLGLPSPGLPHFVSPFVSAWHPVIRGAAPASGAFPSANTAYYTPLYVPQVAPVRRLFWVNGSTVSESYNVDVGIYSDAGGKPGTRLVSSGSTAQGTASVAQFVDVADIALAPGLYWLAITCSSTLATFFRTTTGTGALDTIFGFEEASALPLPATATPVELSEATPVALWGCGFATTASP
jgi:hypothetical protein